MYLQTAMVRCEVEVKILKGSWTSGKVSVPRKEALFNFLLGKTSAILPCYSGFWNVVVQMTYGSLFSILLLTFFCSTPPSPTVSTDLFSSSQNTELHLRTNTKLQKSWPVNISQEQFIRSLRVFSTSILHLIHEMRWFKHILCLQ